MHKTSEDEISELVRTKIDNLRHQLLDLSRRNPLVSTRFSNRSSSYVRVVDELPDQLLFTFLDGNDMAFASLPSLDDEPGDERSRRFQNRLSEALLTDPVYLDAIDKIDPDEDDALERTRDAERQLRDRLRDELGMPPRQTRHDTSLAQHARNNGISPSYELPSPSEQHGDGRHDDDHIQTLLLPDTLDRTMTRLLVKSRTWEQETGINVFHAAFGFLEWDDESQSQLSPLVLLKVRVEPRKTRHGPEYRVHRADDDATSNRVLAERLRVRHSLTLPGFSGGSVEDYMTEVAELAPRGMTWRVRRYVAFGVFPSAQMSMYEDLAAENLVPSDIVDSLLAGSPDSAASPFESEYHVDEPEIESKVPLLVTDADSSQFSTMVDVADGRNLAVEGPPGTGKSQTIVNIIACALAEGKKVLFVAEKLAALEVVHSRLAAMGIGPYLLPLQASRSTREGLIQSLRERLDMTRPERPREIERMRTGFRTTREDLARYIGILASTYGRTGLTVHEVLGRSMKTSHVLGDAPKPLATPHVPNVADLDTAALDDLSTASSELALAWESAASCEPTWSGLSMTDTDRFTLERVFGDAVEAARTFDALQECEERLAEAVAPDKVSREHVANLTASGQSLCDKLRDVDLDLVERVFLQDAALIEDFLAQCEAHRARSEELRSILTASPGAKAMGRLDALIEIIHGYDLSSPDVRVAEAEIERLTGEAAWIEHNLDPIETFIGAVPVLHTATLGDLERAHRLVRDTDRGILALRSGTTTDPGLRAVIVRSAKRGRELAGRWRSLAKELSLDPAGDPGRIKEAAMTIRTTGFFGRLGARYRNARRLYRSLHASDAYRREQAVRHLDELATLLTERHAFEADPQRQSVFGGHFRGLDTDWAQFERTVDFAASVETQFNRLDQAPIREFLLTGDLFQVSAIPAFSDRCGRLETVEANAIREAREELEKRAEALREAREALVPAATVIASPPNFDIEGLKALREDVAALVEDKKRLNKSKTVKRVLGSHFAGVKTPGELIRRELSLASDMRDEESTTASLLLALAQRGVLDACLETGTRFISLRLDADARLDELFNQTGVQFANEEDNTYRATSLRMQRASEDRDGFVAHANLRAARDVMRQTGFLWIADNLTAAGKGLQRLEDVSAAVVVRAMAMDVFSLHGRHLNQFSGQKLDTLRERLASLNRDIQKLDRQQLQALLHERARPPAGNSRGLVRTFTEMGLIDREINKKKRFVSPRDMTRRAGRALLELKPCWMMSPLAISNYIRKGDITFDLCIIDEASQMPPENAIGALMRSGQAMVVGDTNQLPPTSFFRMMLDDQDADEDETVLSESILELANATFRPKRRLRWHYRSRHSSLIKFSNHYIYDNDLVVFPGAFEDVSDMGVTLRKVNGRYANGVNRTEAEAVVSAVLEFMKQQPDRSLGVVTLNQKQRDLLNELMDQEVYRNHSAADYVEAWQHNRDGLEAFFIKNLENVQGDERDTIFISTVYGPERHGGPVANRFGPINGVAGRRRLNVLFTRAKHQIVTFTSMTSLDIKAETSQQNAGAFLLRRWLEYAATGILEADAEARREPDSAFEEFVIEQIEAMGCEAIPQVGSAGYFIDIGVRHPKWPHGFILGVECDGAAYHSSKSARDRDRLRQEVLEDRGWVFHRVWSTDWFNDPRREAEKLRQRIESRLQELMERADFRWVPDEIAATRLIAAPEDTAEVSRRDPGAAILLDAPPPVGVQVGDTVQVRYLDRDGTVLRFAISDNRHAPDEGVIHRSEPITRAVLDAETGEEVEVLVGS